MDAENVLSTVFAFLLLILSVISWFILIKRYAGARYGKVKSVKAVVADKYKYKGVSRFSHGTLLGKETYVIVFQTEKEKLSFSVSEYSYGYYRTKQRGTLRYRGNQIVEFK